MSTVPSPGSGPAIGPGDRLREWEIIRFLGRGSFGTVYEARRSSWVTDHARRAIKVFDPVLSSAARAALIAEFETLSSVEHPNLLAGDDAFDITEGPHAGSVVFVMELADEDLGSRAQHSGGVPGEELAAIGAQVADGLSALHGQGRIHGDVKPENILRVGDRWTIGDFGLSTALDGSYAFTAGATIDYRPPEHAAAPAGSRMHRSADVWALGVTLHVAATLHHPFVGPDPVMRLAAAIRGDRTATTVEPAALRAVVDDACLRPEPRDRPDATAVADRLRAVAAGAGPSAAPPSWAPAAPPVGPPAPAGVVGPTVPVGAPEGQPTVPVGAPTTSWPTAAPAPPVEHRAGGGEPAARRRPPGPL
ncbi:MAG: serine/threonine-protein kinase, partial [Acidimicrobiales bacterium]